MHALELPDHLWKALEVMASDAGVEPEAVARQAVLAWLRINGYLVPSAIPGPAPSPLPPAALTPVRPADAAALDQVAARLKEVDADLEQLTRPRPAWAEEPGESLPPADAEAEAPALSDPEGPSEEVPALQPDGPEPVTGVAPRAPVVDEPEFEGTALLKGHPLAAYIEREGSPRVEVTGDRFVIGRGPQCDLIIDSPRVSREHAAVLRTGLGFTIEDLGSSNGTFIGEERVTRQELQSGDVLRLGNEVMLVVIRAAEPSLQ